jgi:hypothetical protein
MADPHTLSADALVRKVLSDDHADLVREAVVFLCDQIMEAEVSAQIGAGYGERAPEARTTQRNGYRERRWDTRAGTLELFIPKLRAGSYFPSFLEPRTRSEQALLSVVMEAFVNGVSTRKVERVVEQLGVAGMSKSQVSRICAELDERVQAFRCRPLEGRYPYLWLDAKVEKVRDVDGRVRRKSLVVAYAVHEAGYREVIALDVGASESGPFWREFLRGLVARGLCGVELVISDAHEGLKNAVAQVLGCPWQRSSVKTAPGGSLPPVTPADGREPWQRDPRGPTCRPAPPAGGGLAHWPAGAVPKSTEMSVQVRARRGVSPSGFGGAHARRGLRRDRLGRLSASALRPRRRRSKAARAQPAP